MKLKDKLVSFVKKIILSLISSIIIWPIIISLSTLIIEKFNYCTSITINYYAVYALQFLICFLIPFVYIFSEDIYFFLKNKIYKSNIDYYRELPRDYSPSMVSFLMNLKTEYKKDILADLIFLEERKIIEIDNNQNITIISENTNFKDYEKHLSVVMDGIFKKDNSTINDLINIDDWFFQKKYKDSIVADLRKLNLIEDYSREALLKKILFVLFLIAILLSALLFIFGNMSFIDKLIIILVLIIPILFILIFCVIIAFYLIEVFKKQLGKNFMRSKIGKKDVSLWLSYDRFIRHFSIMEERNIEEKKLWGYYFAYGLSLGINKKVMKKFNLEYEKYIIK